MNITASLLLALSCGIAAASDANPTTLNTGAYPIYLVSYSGLTKVMVAAGLPEPSIPLGNTTGVSVIPVPGQSDADPVLPEHFATKDCAYLYDKSDCLYDPIARESLLTEIQMMTGWDRATLKGKIGAAR